MVAFGTLLVLLGWWLLAAAMSPRDPPPPHRRRAMRVGGGGAFAISLAFYVAAIGFEQGPVFWVAVLMLGALAVALVRAFGGDTGGRRRALSAWPGRGARWRAAQENEHLFSREAGEGAPKGRMRGF